MSNPIELGESFDDLLKQQDSGGDFEITRIVFASQSKSKSNSRQDRKGRNDEEFQYSQPSRTYTTKSPNYPRPRPYISPEVLKYRAGLNTAKQDFVQGENTNMQECPIGDHTIHDLDGRENDSKPKCSSITSWGKGASRIFITEEENVQTMFLPAPSDMPVESEDELDSTSSSCSLLCRSDQEQSSPECWRVQSIIGALTTKTSNLEYGGHCKLGELASNKFQDVNFWLTNTTAEGGSKYVTALERDSNSRSPPPIVMQVLEQEEILIVPAGQCPRIDKGGQSEVLMQPVRAEQIGLGRPTPGVVQSTEAEQRVQTRQSSSIGVYTSPQGKNNPPGRTQTPPIPKGLSEYSLKFYQMRISAGYLPAPPLSSDSVSMSCQSLSTSRFNSLESLVPSIFDHSPGIQSISSAKSTPPLPADKSQGTVKSEEVFSD